MIPFDLDSKAGRALLVVHEARAAGRLGAVEEMILLDLLHHADMPDSLRTTGKAVASRIRRFASTQAMIEAVCSIDHNRRAVVFVTTRDQVRFVEASIGARRPIQIATGSVRVLTANEHNIFLGRGFPPQTTFVDPAVPEEARALIEQRMACFA